MVVQMKIFSEMGVGLPTFFSSEFELEDGREFRLPGIWVRSISEVYVRIWIGRRVLILSSKEGIKTQSKPKNRFNLVLGLCE